MAESVDTSDQKWGSDLIADLLRAYEFEFVPFNPGASFRGIEESIVNYNDNDPTVITTPHEGLSVSIAHGYAKATGEPSVCILHDIVGTLNGTMGIYNAYIDQVPILILAGNGPLRKSRRRPWIDWMHTATDQGSFVRDFVKWDDQPIHSDGVTESIVRGYNISRTFPEGPVYVTLDHDVQENELESPIEIPDLDDEFGPPSSVAADPDALESAAEMLTEAEFPVIFTGRVGNSQETVDSLVELAETLGAAVIDTRKRHRYNFPNRHPLNASGTDIFTEADVILALNVDSLLQEFTETDIETHEITDVMENDYELIDIGRHDLEASSLTGDTFSLIETTLPILGDVELAIPALLDRVEAKLDDTARKRASDRFEIVRECHEQQWESWQRAVENTRDDVPISVPRIASEVWNTIRNDEWVLVSGTLQRWAHKVWNIDSADKYIGGYSGGGGVGYGIGAAIGAALAYTDADRIPVNLQADGDLIQYLNGLWTLGHYQIPLFTVVHNNGTLYNSTNHRMKLAEHRGRDASYERALIGTGLVDPVPDYATVAEALGVNGYGPVEDPTELGGVLQSAWNDVKNGEPALVDVVSQDR